MNTMLSGVRSPGLTPLGVIRIPEAARTLALPAVTQFSPCRSRRRMASQTSSREAPSVRVDSNSRNPLPISMQKKAVSRIRRFVFVRHVEFFDHCFEFFALRWRDLDSHQYPTVGGAVISVME